MDAGLVAVAAKNILRCELASIQVAPDLQPRPRRVLPAGNTCPKGQLTNFPAGSDDEPMTELAQSAPRRSKRVFHKMRLQALGRNHEGRKFREICETLVVSAHGGLLNLRHEVDNGEMLVLVNPETQEEQECRIVYLGDPGNKGTRVGVEFLTPAPHFWGIDFDAQPVLAS
jgi:hypothetical protein